MPKSYADSTNGAPEVVTCKMSMAGACCLEMTLARSGYPGSQASRERGLSEITVAVVTGHPDYKKL